MSLRDIDTLIYSDLKEVGEYDERVRHFNTTVNRLAFFEARIKGLEVKVPLTEKETAYIEDLNNLNTYLKKPGSVELRNYNFPVRFNGTRKISLSANFTLPSEPILSYSPSPDSNLYTLVDQKVADFFLDLKNKVSATHPTTAHRTDHISFYYSLSTDEDGSDRFLVLFRTHKDDLDLISTVPNLLIKDYVQVCYSEAITDNKEDAREAYSVFVEFLKTVKSKDFDFKERIDFSLLNIIKNAQDFWFSVIKDYTPSHYKEDLRFTIFDRLFKKKIQ